MADYLVILESPAKAKTIGKFLGRKYKVLASVGHLRDLPKSRIAIDIENGFEPQYTNIRGKADIINELKKEAKAAKKVYLASDPDREGEAIAWHLAYLLGIDPRSDCRVTFNAVTKDAVLEGFKSPRAIDMDLVDSYQARRVLDRIVGYKISPILWKKVKKGLSGGRVQSAVVRMICDREDEIEAFEPQEYWNISAKLSKKTSAEKQSKAKTFTARFYGDKKKKINLKEEADVKPVLEEVKNNPFIVYDIKNTDKKQSPPSPFTTSALQQEAARKLNFNASKTMMIAQQLYEGIDLGKSGATGIVTYIRTDSVRISDEAAKLAGDIIRDEFGDGYLPAKRRIYKNKNSSQDAHEAIRPAHIEYKPEDIASKLTPDQLKLYKLIYDRFMASQMADAVISVCTLSFEVGKYVFKASGNTVKFAGYTKVYEESFDDKEEVENKVLPVFENGEEAHIAEIIPQQHFTQPPPRYNEASIVKAMEEYGIGRPSTYATTITTIQTRGYVGKEKKSYYPTELGRIVNDLMKGSFANIVDVAFTAGVESELDIISQGNKDWRNVVSVFYNDFEKDLIKAEKEVEHVVIKPKESDEPCEKCGRLLVYRQGKFGDFLACPGFPECRFTKAIIEFVGVKCPECSNELIYRKSKSGRKYVACSGYPDCKFTSLNVPTGERCPECGSHLERVRRRNYSFVACSNAECNYKPNAKKTDGETDEKDD
ncbi:MAG: type I DNA topoisomerase [Ruminococcaceae bacterium]|nr:type I DNA topoisomerase [Oscillospiraceae bacterium]